jgi:hypothetical protein
MAHGSGFSGTMYRTAMLVTPFTTTASQETSSDSRFPSCAKVAFQAGFDAGPSNLLKLVSVPFASLATAPRTLAGTSEGFTGIESAACIIETAATVQVSRAMD